MKVRNPKNRRKDNKIKLNRLMSLPGQGWLGCTDKGEEEPDAREKGGREGGFVGGDKVGRLCQWEDGAAVVCDGCGGDGRLGEFILLCIDIWK